MDTHENIKRLREQLGLSQDQLAKLVGYNDRSSIAKIESGKVDLTQSKVAAFAKALHVAPAQLMGLGNEDAGNLSAEDVGVFYVDGDVLIKQLFVDPMHNIYLLSANPRREDANKMISHNSTSTLMCFGKVLISKLPRPNYF